MCLYLWLQVDISSMFYKSPHHCVMPCIDCFMQWGTCPLKIDNKVILYPCSTHSLSKTHIWNYTDKPKEPQASVHIINTRNYYLPIYISLSLALTLTPASISTYGKSLLDAMVPVTMYYLPINVTLSLALTLASASISPSLCWTPWYLWQYTVFFIMLPYLWRWLSLLTL